ncbi:hypothetical protein G5C51_40625, partial [Streptomyces sp. A7024]
HRLTPLCPLLDVNGDGRADMIAASRLRDAQVATKDGKPPKTTLWLFNGTPKGLRYAQHFASSRLW